MRLRKITMTTLILAMLTVVALPISAAQFASPVLLTAAGQSADVAMAKVLLGRTSASVTLSETANVANLGASKSLVFVIGASTKGLGAAGINFADELARVKSLAEAARKAGVKVVAMHLGGSARRGDSSDQLIKLLVPLADAVIVVASGNSDKIFDKNLRSGANLYSVDKIASASVPLETLFGKK